MLIVRPVRISDLPHVEHMAVESGIGVTSLPNNREKLYEKIQNSLGAFEHEAIAGTGREYYMFVLEDEGRVVGTASISASAGFEEPFYSYRSETMVHASRALKVNNRIHVLTMCHDLTGLVQLCGFYCDPQYTMRAYACPSAVYGRCPRALWPPHPGGNAGHAGRRQPVAVLGRHRPPLL
jgi:arginine N-succinyltransferase